MPLPLIGRKATLWDVSSSPAVQVAGLQAKTVTVNNEPVDITSDDDNGFRTLLADPGTRSIDLSIEGVAKDTNFLVAATGNGSALLKSFELRFTGIGTIACDFYLSSVELGAPYNEAVTFSGSLVSSGEFTYTAVP